MKRSRHITKYVGILIAVVAAYLSFRNVQWDHLLTAMKSMQPLWLIAVIVVNFGVVALKAVRWQAMIQPVKKTSFVMVLKVLIIGFMANNLFPARFGELLRIHLLGRNESVNRTTSAATLVADRIIEGMTFLIIAFLLIFLHKSPVWMKQGILITSIITLGFYAAAVVMTRKGMIKTWESRPDSKVARFLGQATEGLHALTHMKLMGLATMTSLLSWIAQGVMIYFIQIAYGIQTPLWGIVLLLVAVNLAIAVPSAPSNIGTFEFACVLAYQYMGIDKSTALLLGITYHLLQVIPVTIVGIVLTLSGRVSWTQIPEEPDIAS